MARLAVALALVALLASGLAPSTVGAQPPDGLRKIVVFQAGVNEAAKDSIIKGAGGVTLVKLGLINAVAVWLPDQAARVVAQNPAVLRVDEDAIVTAMAPKPSPTPTTELQWGVDRIDADLAWGTSRGAGVKVAVIDTGIDKDHPDLAANIKGGQNFVAQRGSVNPGAWDDDNGHGTHVAGIVAALGNGSGVVGVAPDAWLYGVKVLDKRGSGYVSDVIAGIDWSVANGIQVINMSLGTTADVQSLHDAVDAAYAAGLVLVAAAGNSGDTSPDNDVIYPARYSSVIAVAATDKNDLRAAWSSDGPEVELAAPGVAIMSTYKGGAYKELSGTSMASPHVAGTAALVIAANPGITNVNVRANLTGTADDLGPIGRDTYYGYGLVDAQQAATGVQTLP